MALPHSQGSATNNMDLLIEVTSECPRGARIALGIIVIRCDTICELRDRTWYPQHPPLFQTCEHSRLVKDIDTKCGTVVPQQVIYLFRVGCGDTLRWFVRCYHALGGQQREVILKCPRGAKTALNNYSDTEAVRSRG